MIFKLTACDYFNAILLFLWNLECDKDIKNNIAMLKKFTVIVLLTLKFKSFLFFIASRYFSFIHEKQ